MNHKVTVLIIEDDPNIVELLKLYLEKNNYHTIEALDGEAGLETYYQRNPDCIILDLMLPKTDGLEVCRMIRLDDRKTPIIMLTGKGESYDIIKGLNLGADDYVVKPFDPNELIARIQSVLRRSVNNGLNDQTLTIDNMTIVPHENRIIINDEEIFLPPREVELLYYFGTHKNQVLSREQLLNHIWGLDYEGDSRTVDVHIKRIREKLQLHHATWSVKTIRGVGYRFEVKRDA